VPAGPVEGNPPITWLQFTFPKLSDAAVSVAGHRFTLAAVMFVTVIWAILGTILGFPTQWFLLSNTIGTMVSLLILLLMQHSQNRDMRALQVKMDELIRSSATARNHLIGIEQREANDIEKLASTGPSSEKG
jgi:low affinity Fe/Cu permease